MNFDFLKASALGSLAFVVLLAFIGLTAPGAEVAGLLRGPSGTAAAFSADGHAILTAGRNEAQVWDANTLRQITPPFDHGGAIRRAGISPDGKLAYTAGGKEVCIWNAESGKRVAVLKHDGAVLCTAFSPTAKCLVTGCEDRAAVVWDVLLAKRLLTLWHPQAVQFATFSPDGSKVLTEVVGETDTCTHGAVYLWNSVSGEQLHQRCADDWGNQICNWWRCPAAFSPDSKRVAVSVFRDISIWEIDRPTHFDSIETSDLGAGSALTFSADGRLLAACGVHSAQVFDVTTGKPAGAPLSPDFRTNVADAVFSPDGKWLLIASEADQSGLWNVKTGMRAIKSSGTHSEVPAIAFSPHGDCLVMSFKTDGFTTVWRPNRKNRQWGNEQDH